MGNYLKYLFQLVLSPGHGWEDVERADADPRRLLTGGYYPLIAVMALSALAGLFFHHYTFLTLFVRIVVLFVVYFVGYYFGVFMLSVFSDPMLDDGFDDRRAATFTAYVLGIEAVINIVMLVVPVTPLVLFFLPIYVALVEWKGVGYMKVKPEKVGLFMILAIFGVMMPPYIFYYLFSIIL